MRAVVWITEGSWEACVDQAAALLPAGAEITLLHVSPRDVEEVAARGGARLLGRHPPPPPGPPLRVIAEEEAQALLAEARARLAEAQSRRADTQTQTQPAGGRSEPVGGPARPAGERTQPAGERTRPAEIVSRRGRVEREVVAACAGADLLILARDGELRLGPKSLGRYARFVVDHAPCQVLLVWSGPPPGIETIPPPPPHDR